MKKILSLLGTITLIGTNTTILVACNTQEYTPEKLAELKEKNNIKTKDGILEWIAPQEESFNNVDDKWYVVVWHINQNDDWRIIKFKHLVSGEKRVLDKYGIYDLILWNTGVLFINVNKFPSHSWFWEDDDGSHFKSVYRWNGDEQKSPNLIVNSKTDEIKVK